MQKVTKLLTAALLTFSMASTAFAVAPENSGYHSIKSVEYDGGSDRLLVYVNEAITPIGECQDTRYYEVPNRFDIAKFQSILLAAHLSGKKVRFRKSGTMCGRHGTPAIDWIMLH